jgi:tetratricopeptide (TPR) repeat protein
MTSMDTLRDAMRLAQEHRVEEALELLDEGIRVATELGNVAHVASLASAAGTLSWHRRELRATVGYYGQAAQAAPNDPYTQFALTEGYAELGENELSRQHRERFVELAGASTDPDVQEFLSGYLARQHHRPGKP